MTEIKCCLPVEEHKAWSQEIYLRARRATADKDQTKIKNIEG